MVKVHRLRLELPQDTREGLLYALVLVAIREALLWVTPIRQFKEI